MLVIYPVFYFFFLYFPWDPQGWLRSNKLLNRTVSCKLVGNFTSLYPSSSKGPIQPHSVLGRDIIQHFLALSYQWGHCFGDLKTLSELPGCHRKYIFLWSKIHLNFTSTGPESIYLSLKTVPYFPTEILGLLPTVCPLTPALVPFSSWKHL
jgi:hypothetical protein